MAVLAVAAAATLLANQPPVIDSLASSAGWVPPRGTVTLTVNAHDPDCTGSCTTGCGAYISASLTTWSASGGTLGSPNNGASGSPYSASVSWQAPDAEGTYSVTVTIADSGTSFGCGGRITATASLSILVSAAPPNQPPVVTGITWDRNPLSLRETSVVSVSATDPEGGPLSFAWSTDAGTLSPSTSGTAVFTAPSTPCLATVTCTVTDSQGASTTATSRVTVTSALAERMLAGALVTPTRAASLPDGSLAVADPGAGGVLVIDGQDGGLLLRIPLEGVVGVATDGDGRLVVGGKNGAGVSAEPGSFSFLPLDPGQTLGEATDVAVDGTARVYAVLYGQAGRVVLFDGQRNLLAAFGSNGDGPDQFKGATALAVAPTGEILVGDTGHGTVHVFDQTGNQIRSFGSLGAGPGQFVQIGGIAVDAFDLVYVSDPFQSWVQVYSLDGTFRETLGRYGSGLGEFQTPSGLTLRDSPRQLVVASTNSSRLQFFSSPNGSSNRPPTVPAPLAPVPGAEFAPGSPVALEVYNAQDPEGQPVEVAFELYGSVGGASTLLHSWTAIQTTANVTQVDASSFAAVPGEYTWRARAFDGLAYSPWSAWQSFRVGDPAPPQNQPPFAPILAGPDGGEQLETLEPTLTVLNATDPEGDAVSYTFEVALLLEGGTIPLAVSPPKVSGPEVTSWQVPGGVLAPSLLVSWRCRAFDGTAYGPWSPWGYFWTPPFPIPSLDEVGNLPAGDTTRPAEVRFRIGPTASDVTLYFQVFNVADGELTVAVGQASFSVARQAPDEWSRTVAVVLPAGELSPDGPTTIRFLHGPAAKSWGVRNVALVPPVSDRFPSLRATAYNTVVDLSWAPDPELPPGTRIKIYSATGSPAIYFPAVSLLAGSSLFRHTDLSNGIPYSYRAAYLWPDGREGPPSPPVTATPSASGGPTPITDLKVSPSGGDLVLTWTPVTSEPAIQAVDLFSGPLGEWPLPSQPMATVGALENQYTLPGAAAGPDGWFSAVPYDLDGARATP